MGMTAGTSAPRTREEEFYIPILRVVASLGNAAHKQDVVSRVERQMRARLTPTDYGHTPGVGELRYFATIGFARKRLKDFGLLGTGSQHGVWELTCEGLAIAKADNAARELALYLAQRYEMQAATGEVVRALDEACESFAHGLADVRRLVGNDVLFSAGFTALYEYERDRLQTR